MEYRDYFIEKNGSYIIIKNAEGTRLYASKINLVNIEEVNEIGKRIIDLGINIIENKGKKEYMAFQSIYPLNQNNDIKEYTENPEGKIKKQEMRNRYKKMMTLLCITDFILMCLAVMSKDMVLLFGNLLLLLFSILGMIMSFSKKDFYNLGKAGEAMSTAASVYNGKMPSGYGGGMTAGPALRYIIPGMVIRIVLLILIICEFRSFSPTIAIIELILNILVVVFSGKIINVVSNYRKINEDGVSDFVSPKL